MLSLDDPKYKDLLKWLVNLAEQKIQNGSRWNFKDDITQLGLEIFKETYQHFSAELQEKITDRTFLQKYTGDLKKLQHTFQSEIQKLAKEGLDMIHSNGLIAKDFKAHTITPLETFAKGNLRELTITFRKLPEKEENYYTKTTTLKADIQQVVNNGLNDLIEKFIQFANLFLDIFLHICRQFHIARYKTYLHSNSSILLRCWFVSFDNYIISPC